MKLMLTAALLASLTAPVSLYAGTDAALTVPGAAQDIDRRSGRCPHRPDQPVIAGQDIMRERSTNTCGGV